MIEEIKADIERLNNRCRKIEEENFKLYNTIRKIISISAFQIILSIVIIIFLINIII